MQWRLNNLPKVTRQEQWSQAPAVTAAVYRPLLSYVLLYWFKSSYEGAVAGHNDSSTWAAARWFAEIFFFFLCWVLELLGNSLVPWGPVVMTQGIVETEIFLQGTLVMNFVSFWLWPLLFGNKKDTHPIRIIVIPCIRKGSKVLETGKQEVSTPLMVGLLCLLVYNVCLL